MHIQNKPHILFILDYYLPHYGGAETVYYNIISRLVDEGYHIFLITMQFDTTLPKKEKIAENFIIYRIGNSRKSFQYQAIFLGYRILKAEKIDFIHTAIYGGAFPAWVLGKIFKKKCILIVHEVFGKLRKVFKGPGLGYFYRMFEKLLFSLSFSTYQCVSRYTLNSLRLLYGIPDRKLHLIYNGIDENFWNPESVIPKEIINYKMQYHLNAKHIGLYYGHVGKSKGIDFLIEAIIPYLKKHSDIQFIFNIIHSKNSQKYIQKLKTLVEKHQLENQLIVLSGLSKEKLRTLIASIDFVIAPSLSEGFGFVHLETCLMKKILITTEVAAIPEIVYNKVYFIPTQNHNAISQAISQVCKGKYNNIEKKKFDWIITLEKIKYMYMCL